jgi:hypothetical protein
MEKPELKRQNAFKIEKDNYEFKLNKEKKFFSETLQTFIKNGCRAVSVTLEGTSFDLTDLENNNEDIFSNRLNNYLFSLKILIDQTCREQLNNLENFIFIIQPDKTVRGKDTFFLNRTIKIMKLKNLDKEDRTKILTNMSENDEIFENEYYLNGCYDIYVSKSYGDYFKHSDTFASLCYQIFQRNGYYPQSDSDEDLYDLEF